MLRPSFVPVPVLYETAETNCRPGWLWSLSRIVTLARPFSITAPEGLLSCTKKTSSCAKPGHSSTLSFLT
jgi:hypothetical protein